MQRLLQFGRDHYILFGSTKFVTGLFICFGLGIYFLPFLIAEKGLSETELAELTSSAQAQTQLRTGEFVRDDRIWLDGAIAPGPDYWLYLTKGQFTTRTVFWPRNRKPCKLRR